MDKEFVPEGMRQCGRCQEVFYCSMDCLEWDWQRGGHKSECKGFHPGQMDSAITINPDDSALIDQMRDDEQKNKSKVPPEPVRVDSATVKPGNCNACGMKSGQGSGIIQLCGGCRQVQYCSLDCLQWDWEIGGHAASCRGSKHDTRLSKNERAGGKYAYTKDSACKSCGMEAEFVPDGMRKCGYCHDEKRESFWSTRDFL